MLAVFGTGVQAESQIEAVSCVRRIEEILIFSRHHDNAERFASRMAAHCSAALIPARDLSELKRADIICTATDSLSPLFESIHVKPGAHLNAINSFRPEMCEFAPDLIASSQLVVDQVEAALEEAGDIIQALRLGVLREDQVLTEIGHLLSRSDSPRAHPEVTTLFKSVGSAVQDFLCAQVLYERARTSGEPSQ